MRARNSCNHQDELSLHSADAYQLVTLDNVGDLSRLVCKPTELYQNDNRSYGETPVNVWVDDVGEHACHSKWNIDVADVVDRTLGALGSFIIASGHFLSSHNPCVSQGRRQIRRSVLRSGPAYQSPSIQGEKCNEKQQFSGWRMGALLNICLLTLCLVVEITMISVAFSMDKKSSQAFDGVLYRGNCTVTKRWTSVLSLLLNLIATLLIGSSNYMMQCFTAPTTTVLRQEHKRGRSVHLGVMSTRKPLAWWIMGLTSIPVHLFFNSAFFSSLQTNDYAMTIVSADYASLGTSQNCTTITNTTNTADSWTSLACGMVMESSGWDRLNVQDCVKRYSDPFISQYSNVVLVSSLNSSQRTGRFAYRSPHDQADNILGFTLNHTFYTNDSTTLQIWEFPAFFGIFNAFSYKEWRDSYNLDFNISNTTSSLIDIPTWMCNSNLTSICSEIDALEYSSNWLLTPASIPIKQCLSQPTPGKYCELQYSSTILLIVIVCDLLKILVIGLALYNTKEALCVTIGDAISNFTRQPEDCTVNRCLLERQTVEYEHSRASFWSEVQKDVHGAPLSDDEMAGALLSIYERQPVRWNIRRKRRWNATSRWRWWALFEIYVPIVIAACLLTVAGAYTIQQRGVGQLWTRGLLSVDQNAIFPWSQFNGYDSGDSAFLLQVVLINTPQLLFSLLYYVFNGTFTNMHAAKEWAGFATKRKALRVTNPEPGQRSTYWLSLPWSYSLPLVVMSGLLHWLLSRSLYLVRVNVTGPDGKENVSERISACGFSVLMMLFVFLLLCLLAYITFWFGYQKLDAAIPLVGVESAAISAACHHPNDPKTEALKPLLWGVVEKPEHGKPGHCSLSSGPVEHPVEGEDYW